jgi:hypothetical protein
MKFAEEFRKIAKELSALAREGRELSYSEGAIGITELISCPIKAELRRQYPEISAESIAIDDGFFFEKAVKEVLRRLYGERFEEEKVLPYQIDGLNIEGHLDCFINYDERTVVGIELKHTLLAFDNSGETPEPLIILEDGSNRVAVNPKYSLQAKIQRKILEELYPDKEVELYIFLKTTLRDRRGRLTKSLVVVPITQSITEEELKRLARAFREDRRPRAAWECRYCVYKKEGLCEGSPEHSPVLSVENGELISSLLERRQELQTEIGVIEEQLKRLINGTVVWKGKECGWVPKRTVSWNKEALVELLNRNGLNPFDYLMVNGRKARELERRLGEEELSQVREITETVEFKLPRR